MGGRRAPRLAQSPKTGLFARWLQGAFVPPSAMLATGRRIWVGNAEAHAGTGAPYGIGPWTPLTTLVEAVTLTLDGQHDVIMVMPGHAEDITAADIATTNDGYSIIGIGKGADRPTFTCTAVGSTFHVNSANIYIENCVFTVSADATAVVTVEGDDFHMFNCELREGDTNQAVSYISAAGANTADRMHIEKTRITSLAAGATDGIVYTAAQDKTHIEDCYIHGDFTAAGIESAFALPRVIIERCMVANLSAGIHAIEFSAGSTGSIVKNRLYSSTFGNALDPGACYCSQNLATDAINQCGMPIPAIAAGGFPDDYLDATSFATDSIGASEIAADALGAAEIADAAIDAATYAADAAIWREAVSNWNFIADTGAVASYNVFTVTGDVLVTCYGIDDVACVGAGNISLGVAAGAELIAATVAANLIANEIWHDATPTTTSEIVDLDSTNTAVISAGQDIQFTIGGAVLTDGDVDLYCRWIPLSADGAVVAA